MPPLCAQNQFEVEPIPDWLSGMNELELVLCAKRIIFIKLHNMPVSRWSGMKDKVVNIPITSSTLL